MKPRLPIRSSVLLFAAFSWLSLPAVAFAGPGGQGGGHGGGGGGGHAGGGGGGHSGGYASAGAGHSSPSSSGHAPVSASGPSAGYRGNAPTNYSGVSSNGTAPGTISSSTPSSGAAGERDAATYAALAHLASHGWNFTPSSGVNHLVAAQRAPVKVASAPQTVRLPVILPPHAPITGRRAFATATNIPRPGLGPRRPCFFTGFTTVCGSGFGFFGLGLYPCPWQFGFAGCGYGLGYGFGYGPGYGYGYGYSADGSNPAPTSEYSSPEGNSYMELNGEYVAEPGAGIMPPVADSPAANPDDVGPGTVPAVPAQIILKDGSAYAVKAYWVSNGELYYQPVTGGLNHVPVAQLDLSATVAANSRNGVPFTLTDRPPHN